MIAERDIARTLLVPEYALGEGDQLVTRGASRAPRTEVGEQPGCHRLPAPGSPLASFTLERDAQWSESLPAHPFTTSLRAGNHLVTGFSLQTATLTTTRERRERVDD